ncbi:wall-associated receptor kinase-like 4 [Miscanthus floridulus]|uniref:wall-associated receptor kinase-like 4 n=1 Tax=Miscanthus floridulus TaxID=154761 RepID=UPI00345B1D52
MSRRSVVLFAAAVVAAASVLAPRPALGAATDDVVVALPGCTSHCGNISIPHPFGVESSKCYLPGFNVTCRNSSLFLGYGSVQVLEISIPDATVRINASFAYFPGKDKNNNFLGPNPITNGTWSGALGKGGVYTLSWRRNRMFALGYNVQVLLLEGDGDPNNTTLLSTCSTFCNWDKHNRRWTVPRITDCSGIYCCQANIIKERSSSGFKVLSTNEVAGPNMTARIWIVDSELGPIRLNLSAGQLPVVLDWKINHTTCHGNGSSAACHSSHSFCKGSHGGGGC